MHTEAGERERERQNYWMSSYVQVKTALLEERKKSKTDNAFFQRLQLIFIGCNTKLNNFLVREKF